MRRCATHPSTPHTVATRKPLRQHGSTRRPRTGALCNPSTLTPRAEALEAAHIRPHGPQPGETTLDTSSPPRRWTEVRPRCQRRFCLVSESHKATWRRSKPRCQAHHRSLILLRSIPRCWKSDRHTLPKQSTSNGAHQHSEPCRRTRSDFWSRWSSATEAASNHESHTFPPKGRFGQPPL